MDVDDQQALVARINALIAERVSYGTRKVVVTKPSVQLSWSNGQCGWWVTRCLPGQYVLDANQVLIEGVGVRKVEAIAKLLDRLPLYANSFEARFGQQVLYGSAFERAAAARRATAVSADGRTTIGFLVDK